MKLPILVTLFITLPALCVSSKTPSAPTISAYPKSPGNFKPASGRQNSTSNVCEVKPNQTDAAPGILAAAHTCNNGGTVFLPPGDFVVATALDLTFLNNIDFAIWGNITFKKDIDLWTTQAFQYTFQTASLFWRFGGNNVNIYGDGKGVIDGEYFFFLVLDLLGKD